MNASPQISASDISSSLLDGPSVLAAAAAVCGVDRVGAVPAKNVLTRLLVADDWALAVKRLNQAELPLRHHVGPLRGVLEIPGDLILLRRGEGTFALLGWLEQRWQFLGGDGTPLAIDVTGAVDADGEAVALQLPRAGGMASGFASLAALWPELRAAWAEVGGASLFINTGQLLLPLFSMLVYDKIAQNGLF